MNTIICPNCKQEVEISEALRHQIREQELGNLKRKYDEDLAKKKTEIEEKAKLQIRQELEFALKDSKNEATEAKEQNKRLQEQILEFTKQIRSLQQKNEEKEIERQKQLILDRTKMQEEISKTEKEKSGLEILEIKKQLDDTKKALEEAQRKAMQKSQQLQGEVLEQDIEIVLKEVFPQDDIQPIGKGISGADIRHIVKSPKGYQCGVILWESKRTKDWSDKWLVKLKDDLRAEKANIPIIVSMALPNEAKEGIGLKDGVWICGHTFVIPMAMLVRKNLLDIAYQRAVSANREGKAELAYSFIVSQEFQQQIENVVEAYKEMQIQIQKERVAFEKIWKQRETQARRIILSTANIYGAMQGIIGAPMPQIKGLELLEASNDN